MPSPAPDAASPPHIELQPHGDFVAWLTAARGTLAVTTYNSGKLALFAAPHGQLEAGIYRLARPMGLAYDAGRLAVATRDAIVQARLVNGAWQRDAPLATGRLDVHEMAFDARGLVFANTRCNCLARPSARASFRRIWTPEFLATRLSRDCCHLNGIGLRWGRVAVVTALCTGSEPGSWRAADRYTSGVAFDVRRQRVIAGGLSLPHSPRFSQGRWWLCNSGEGALATFDPARGTIAPLAILPGFTRGLAFASGRALVGLSHIRKRHILDAPPVRRRFARLRSGVWLIDVATGRPTGALEFVRGGREVFDVAFLPNVLNPNLPQSLATPAAW